MGPATTQSAFLRIGTLAAAGLLAAFVCLAGGSAPPASKAAPQHQPAPQDFPRDHAGPGGPVGSATDRGKLVPGRRSPTAPPVLVETPDLPSNLPWKMVKGVKEFHLH